VNDFSLETVMRSQGCNSAPFYLLTIGVLTMNKKSIALSTGAALSAVPVVAFAAVPAAVTTAITDAVADVGTIGAAILGVIVVIASFAWMRRPIR
jgi:hypothetical protein